MKKSIRKVAVLGSGVMGSRIACHFAGIGVEVFLLDMIPQTAKTSTLAKDRNQLVNDSLQAAIKSNPSPVFYKDVVQRITTGNFDDKNVTKKGVAFGKEKGPDAQDENASHKAAKSGAAQSAGKKGW